MEPGAAGIALRRILNERQNAAIEEDVRGDEIAAERCKMIDRAIALLIGASEGSALSRRLAVFATGGYGRGLLAPHSDIDVLVLHGESATDAIKPEINQLLYPLWDAGLTVGQGVHTVASAMALARKDLPALTSYLDARLITGDARLAADFLDAFDQYRSRQRANFTRGKLAEQKARHAAHLASSGWIEPNLKEGRGGLRDIDLIGWLYRFNEGDNLWNRKSAEGYLNTQELRELKKARLYLWAVRVHLHQLNGRADDNVRFDVQPALADILGYDDRRHIAAPERMLKHLRLTSDSVSRILAIAAARMEERYAGLLRIAPRPTPRVLLNDEAPGEVNVRLKTNRVTFADPDAARTNPLDLMRLVRASSKRPDLDVHPDAIEIMTAGAAMLTRETRDDEYLKAVFLGVLKRGKSPFKTFRLLSDTGLLAKFIPMFGKIAGRIEYGLYRRYSIEDNVFRSIEILNDLKRGKLKDKHPISTEFLSVKDHRTRYFLAVLLQETIWADTDRSREKTERLAFRIARRFVDADTAKDIAWCAARPDALMEAADTRDLSLPRSFQEFGTEVGSTARLKILLVLTVCRMRTISEDSWDEWTRRQIGALYFGARAWLKGGRAELDSWRQEERQTLKDDLSRLLSDWPEQKIEQRLKELSGSLGVRLPPDVLARGFRLIDGAEGKEASVALWPRDGFVEAIALAPDRTGLLANLALAISRSGAGVRMLQAMSVSKGRALDFFVLKPVTPVPPEAHSEFLATLQAAMTEAAAAGFDAPRPTRRRLQDRRTLFEVPSEVRVEMSADTESLLVEAEGRDRPGLLGQLAAALSEIGVIVKSAHVATYGERAVDVFYLQDAPGYKITNARRIQSIERRLLGVLNDE